MSQRDTEARKDWLAKAGILTDALPFMRQYAGCTVVVKFGGHAMSQICFNSIHMYTVSSV